MNQLAVQVERLGKRYTLGEREQYLALRDAIARAWTLALRRLGGDRPPVTPPGYAWALRDVTFGVKEGEVVGVIGHNGAGKSTLLKVLSRITRPTEGRAVIRGRVGSLLEVGSGFHPELTGTENIYLNGAILGMSRAEIDRRFDGIVEFSGVADFLSTPVKRYSTGMYMRLAFAVAAHLEPEVLLVDEVLAVGDAEFQRKCLGRMRELAGGNGRTIVFVSHNMDAIRGLCARTLWIDNGRLRLDGPSEEVIASYLTNLSGLSPPDTWVDLQTAHGKGSEGARFSAMRYCNTAASGVVPRVREPLRFELVVEAERELPVTNLALYISTLGGTILAKVDPVLEGPPLRLSPGENRFVITIRELHLTPGTYRVGLWLARRIAHGAQTVYDHVEAACDLLLSENRETPVGSGQALVACEYDFSVPPALPER